MTASETNVGSIPKGAAHSAHSARSINGERDRHRDRHSFDIILVHSKTLQNVAVPKHSKTFHGFFPKPWAQGSRLVALALGPSQRCSSPRLILAHHWQAFRSSFQPNGTLMMRKARADRHLRIIGRPSAQCCEIRRRSANDAVDVVSVGFAHHWRAFPAFDIVLLSIF